MIRCSEAIFAVADVRATVRFYRDILGFESEWLYEDPPTFGGVRWGHTQVMFCRQPQMQGKTEGLMHMFRVDDIQSIYAKHKSAGAPIIHDLENKPWGMSEYVVRDPNGYHLRFGGVEIFEKKQTATDVLPPHIRIETRTPTIEEYLRICRSVNWGKDEVAAKESIERSLLFVLAIDTRDERAIGITRVCGDRGGYTIWDVAVDPAYQQQRIGTALMEQALVELRKIAPRGAFVGLFTPKPAFYERLGFHKDIGMHIAL